MALDLDVLSLDELVRFERMVETAIVRREKALHQKARQAIEEVAKTWAEEIGVRAGDLILAACPGEVTTGVAKYANPADPTQTWTGRGRRPKWVNDLLAAGGDLEATLIDPTAHSGAD